jgi:hypothetical protein
MTAFRVRVSRIALWPKAFALRPKAVFGRRVVDALPSATPTGRAGSRRGGPGLCKLGCVRLAVTRGFAACCAGRLCLSVAGDHRPTSSAPRGRLRLPGGAEKEKMCTTGRKGRALPHSSGAKPHPMPASLANLDSPGGDPAPTTAIRACFAFKWGRFYEE